MAFVGNADVKVDSSGQNSDNNNEMNLKNEISHLDHTLSKLNPMAKEYVPSSMARTRSEFLRNGLLFTNNFTMQSIYTQENDHFARRMMNFGQSNQMMNRKSNMPQNEDVIKRTVFVSGIDQQVTEEQLADLFLSCGQVVDCRICGDYNSILRIAFIEFTNEEGAKSALRKSGTVFGSHPMKVLLSKTAIEPINPRFLPKSEEEREKCLKTVYCTNIDKNVTQMELEDFFKTACGEIHHLRLLGDYHHQTRIAFVEFTQEESAISALNCTGVVLGELPVRVSPSKSPVRPHSSELN